MAETQESSSDSRVQTACLLILAFVAAGIALYLLRPVLVPFVLALFFTYSLAAIIDAQVRHLHLPPALALLTTAVLGLGVLALVGFLVAISVAEMSAQLKTYGKQVAAITDWVTQYVPLESLGIKRDPTTGEVFTIPQEAVTAAVSTVLAEVTGLVSKGALVLIFVVLLLMGGPKIASGRGSLLDEIAGHVKRYTMQMVLLSALTGALVGATLAVLGVRFALVFGFLAFLLNFIPTIGAVVATLLPVPVIVLSPGLSVATQVLAVAIPAAIQAVIGSFIQPKVLGRSFGLHPVSIVLALIFFGMIWGLVGAFLATPITAVIKIVLERIPATRFAAALLAGTYGESAEHA